MHQCLVAEGRTYHFGMWISPRFQLLLVKEYQRLKADEQKQLEWSAKRELSKINYRIHTDAIKVNLIPAEVRIDYSLLILSTNSFGVSISILEKPNHFLPKSFMDAPM